MSPPYGSASSAKLHALLGALPEAVVTCDRAGEIEFLNQAAERLTGHTREFALGRPLVEALPLVSELEGTPLESPAIACLRTGGSLGPFEARLRDGLAAAGRVIEVSAAPIREPDGPITGVILIIRDVTRAREVAQQLSHQATHDALTDLVNRAEFERRLTQALESTAKQGGKHALGFLDLDGFKRINDVCGHLAGDELLRELGTLLHGCMRARDTVARLGGDEFGILLEHCTPAKAVRIAEEMRKVINDHRFSCGGRTHSMGVSIGIVPVRGDSTSPTPLLSAADAACYQAKRRGGNRVQLCLHTRAPSTTPRLFSGAQSSGKVTLPQGAHADLPTRPLKCRVGGKPRPRVCELLPD
jgi:diguanylate cyclase (GGDEF)-like protein/PAS domain S-box-containing protein